MSSTLRERVPAERRRGTTEVRRRLEPLVQRIPPAALVFAVALACRLGVLLRDGGLRGSNGYDASVYFAAADALIHGRLPYRDFVLLHPPGQMLALTPFASLTNVLSDESAFTIANLGFAVLGAVNAVLVVRVAAAFGIARRPALIGGLFYATWFGAVGAEYLTKLEPLGNLLLLLALLATARAQRRGGWWPSVLAGVPLGLATSVKIWWVAPAAVIIGWHAWTRPSARQRASAAAQMFVGACAGAAVVTLPFFLVSPQRMWAAVITDQLGRYRNHDGFAARIADLTGLPRLHHFLPRPALVVLGVVVAIVLAGAVWRAWRLRTARVVVVLVLVQLAVVFAAPSWFPYYCDYLAVALALTVAVAAAAPARSTRGWTPIVAVSTVTAMILVLGSYATQPYRGATRLSRDVAGYRCVLSDSPLNQIELNALSRGLAAGCPNWVDVTGPTYGPYRSPKATVSRRQNGRWQRHLVRYLRSGDAVIVSRKATLGSRSRAAVTRDGVLARAGGHTVYRVTH